MLGAYITIGISVSVLLLILFMAVYPKLTKRHLVLKWEAPKKRHVKAKAKRKKRKSVWIKVI